MDSLDLDLENSEKKKPQLLTFKLIVNKLDRVELFNDAQLFLF